MKKGKHDIRRPDYAMKDIAEEIMRRVLIRTLERVRDPDITLHPEETDFAIATYKVCSDVEVNDASVQLLEHLSPEQHDRLHEVIDCQIEEKGLRKMA